MKPYQIIKFQDGDFTLDIHVSSKEQTAWLTRDEIALLFERDRTVISKHINKIYSDDELSRDSTCAKNAQVRQEGLRNVTRIVAIYNLDVVVAVGYRVKSQRGVLLRNFLNEYFMSLYETKVSDDARLIIYNNGELSISVNVSVLEETVYLNENQIAMLFETTRQNVNLHIKNILKEGELSQETSRKDFLQHLPDGRKFNVGFYNLDMILAVGYRIKSEQAAKFRKWVSGVLKQYMLKGYAINDTRCLECKNALLELQVRYLELEAKQNASMIFEPGDQLKAFLGVQKFLESAKREVLIIDNYLGHSFDEVLKELDVEKTIITNINNSKIDTCENYKVIKNNIFHDRFVIVDDYCYHFGASIEDVGKNISVGQRINEIEIVKFLKSFKKQN